MNNETIQIKKSNVLASYEEARKSGANGYMQFLENLFGKELFKPKDVTERIKTFKGAIQELGEEHPYVKAYREWMRVRLANQKDIEAYLKLRLITAALNEGWKPEFVPGERRWAPYFVLYTKEECEQLDDDVKARVVYRSGGGAVAHGGVSYAAADHVSASVYACIGSRLAFKSEELAEYAGKQFVDIYADFMLSNQITEE